MGDISQKLNELKPYVVNIRFPDGMSVVDAKFKEGWSLPESKIVGKEPIPKMPNLFMLYTTKEGVGVDEILEYVEKTIKLNVEREKKYELLTVKVRELEALFSKSSLKKCESLKFTFGEESLMSSSGIKINDIPIVDDEEVSEDVPIEEVKESPPPKVNNKIVELPPKPGEKIELEDFEPIPIVCKCGPGQACPVCYEARN